MRYEINLASRPFVDARQFFRQWGIVLAGLALLTFVLSGLALQRWNRSREITKQIRDLEGQTASLREQAATNQRVLNDEKNRTVREQAGFLNDLILRKSYSWTTVFSELEHIMPPQVHLVSMEPKVEAGERLAIGMKIAASSHEKALDFVRSLESSHQFREAHVLNEATDDKPQTKPSDRITMELSVEYAPSRGAGAEIAQEGAGQ